MGAIETHRVALQWAGELLEMTFGWFMYHPIAGLAEGELLLSTGDFEQAVIQTAALVEKMVQNRARTWRPDALLLKAKALRAVGHEREAYATLSEAQTEAKTVGARRSLWQIVAIQ